ncbi:MAG TPA: Rne/Rng family ribonuclease [Bacillota bacterium]|nr:Rne/Rng family ribonuclease [Bacillota bacterium]
MKQVIVNSQYSQTRIAVLEEGKLVEFYIEQPSSLKLVGNIYKGKVADIRPGIQAAFVDIGIEKNAYLYIDDCLTTSQKEKTESKPNIRELVTQGQDLLVQVTKEPTDLKGARLTTHLSFPGRFLVYMPNDRNIGISRRIELEEERERLREICQQLCVEEEGVIVRTQAQGVCEEEIQADFLYLRQEWEKVKQIAKQAKSKSLIHQELGLIPKVARDLLNSEVSEWVIDSIPEYRNILSELDRSHPLQDKIKLYQEQTSIFDAYQIEGEIEKALRRKVWLKSGGYLVIDQTEALTAIDVNTGKFTGNYNHEDTVFKTNLEAAGEIARQLRLRDIGGIIIIDFIDMIKEASRDAVYRHLADQLKKDRTKSHLLGFTTLGLLEMTRKKIKQNLSDRLTRECPCCEGKGRTLSEETIFARMEREIKEYARNKDVEAFLIELSHSVADASKFKYEHFIQLMEEDWKIKVYIIGNDKVNLESYRIAFVGSLEEVKRRVNS